MFGEDKNLFDASFVPVIKADTLMLILFCRRNMWACDRSVIILLHCLGGIQDFQIYTRPGGRHGN